MAVACAPLMPSGWLCVPSAETLAAFMVSFFVSNAQPTGPTRMADPLPQLLYAGAYPVLVFWMTQFWKQFPYPPIGEG